MHKSLLSALVVLGISLPALAEELTVTINAIDAKGVGAAIGSVLLVDTDKGLSVRPKLKNLTPGQHGFHVHEHPNCGPKDKDGKPVAGFAAGGHYDPHTSGKHTGPHGGGHLGDLPALEVAADGSAAKEVLAPRLKVADIKGRALIIHEGGDNYADTPKPLGGGGGRVACGLIPAEAKSDGGLPGYSPY